ncbi:MAG TPA: SLC13 family permease [Anaerolineales bacterium]|nr:SLC13 family permease [Anaerolineales bacterium]
MTVEMVLTLAILALAIVFFVTEWLRVDVVALCVVAALMLTGILTPTEALAGFSNTSVLTIGALFVVGEAVLQTGLAAMLSQRLLKVAGGSEVRLIAILMLAVAGFSSFISSTGTVAVLLPVAMVLARTLQLNPAKLMIPLAYGALLGGTLTLIGTPSNLIISDLLAEAGLRPLGFFSFTPLGAVLTGVGVLFMVLVGRRLLPNRPPKIDLRPIHTSQAVLEHYQLPGNLFHLRVRRQSECAGQTLSELCLRRDFGINVLEVQRPAPARRALPFARENGAPQPAKIVPEAGTRVEASDVLVVQGDGNAVAQAAARWNLGLQPVAAADEATLISDEAGIAEVIVAPRSSLEGQTLLETRFGSTFGLTVIGLSRPGIDRRLDLKTTALRPGDVLLVQGPWRNVRALKQRDSEVVVVGQPEALAGPPRRAKAPLAILVVIGMLVVMITGVLPVATTSVVAALALVLTGCLTIDEAYRAIDWRSIMLIAGMLPMSTALEKTALVNLAADLLVVNLGGLGPTVMLASLFLATVVFTQLLSNTATTVLVAPIALAAATTLGVQPQAFVMAVAIAASMAFATPVASPVNTLVMGAGGYRFGDYAKVGVPLVILTWVVSILVLPLLWGF